MPTAHEIAKKTKYRKTYGYYVPVPLIMSLIMLIMFNYVPLSELAIGLLHARPDLCTVFDPVVAGIQVLFLYLCPALF